jgi:ergothioneine biosynthesis protein EgtB
MLIAQTNTKERQQLFARVADARRQSDALFRIVREDSLYDRPIPERHRIIFYVGHLEAFDWNLLHENVFGLRSFHPDFDRLFAFGIDPVGGGLPSDNPSEWPSLDQVRDYVTKIRAALDDKILEAESLSKTRDGFSLDTLPNVAIEHRLMHVETLAYMLHQLPLDKKISQGNAPSPSASAVKYQEIPIPAGAATLGLPRGGPTFGWDNEFESHIVEVPAFEIERYKVTNQQYLDFIADNGYEKRELWSDDDWKWKVAGGISHPVFWKRKEGGWLYRTMFEDVSLPLDWPAYVSQAEAMVFARWAGKTLPTEAQWHRAAYATADGSDRQYPWGNELPDSNRGNFNFDRWDPAPVNAFPQGQSAFGVHDLVGNGWEWTSTVFGPFPGFQPFPFYRGYSADFFDGKHFVMKGGSPRTAACMLRPTFRNWFQAHYQYVYAAFRCVNSDKRG